MLGVRRRKIDIALTQARLSVFVDGCYWHSWPGNGRSPIVNADYWVPKLARNRVRDIETDQWLASVGWQALRFWEYGCPESVAVDITRTYPPPTPSCLPAPNPAMPGPFMWHHVAYLASEQEHDGA